VRIAFGARPEGRSMKNPLLVWSELKWTGRRRRLPATARD
jgi:hypothetical protein